MTRANADMGGTSRQALAAARALLDGALKGKSESEAASLLLSYSLLYLHLILLHRYAAPSLIALGMRKIRANW